MNTKTGLALRLLGPLIEIGCLLLLKQHGGRGRSVAGLPVDTLLYVGMGVGLVMVVVGLTMVRRPTKTSREDVR